ncbi:MAG: hypothetical protein IPG86_12340, partial [Chitinophagaceae bacterium]|nr:hypothetical protein [Chitinophagaceae bacterium]
AIAALLLPAIILLSCSTKPEPFKPGTDNCHFCKMGITDTRFGGELITKKGKMYKFDDLICLARFLNQGGETADNISKTYTVLFDRPKPHGEPDGRFCFRCRSGEIHFGKEKLYQQQLAAIS